MSFAYSPLFKPDLPPPAGRWNGFPTYNFVGGHIDAQSVPCATLASLASEVLKSEGHTLATYGLDSGPQGYLPLREALASRLQRETHMSCAAEDILIVSGSLQALDLVNEAFLSPGDTVITEASSYGGAYTRLRRKGINIVGAPLDDEGIRIDTLEQRLTGLQKKGIRVKFIYTIPTVQNPTGAVMSERRRRELLKLSERFGVPIFEDDCYADLLFQGQRPPAIRALDDSGAVIYCGSFSKSIAPALRVGYLVADWTVMSQLLALKSDAGSGALEQMMIARFLQTHFNDHLVSMRGTLQRKCDVMVESVAREFGASAEFAVPKGGIFLWVTLPDAVDTSKLAQIAAAEGVAINPGAEWTADPESGRHQLRLCFGHPSEQQIRDGVAKLADICYRETGVPTRSANLPRT